MVGAPTIVINPAPDAEIWIIPPPDTVVPTLTVPLPGIAVVLAAPTTSPVIFSVNAALTVGLSVYGGGGGGTSNAYDNPAYPALTTYTDALNYLLYVAPQITGFSNSVGTVEIGSTVHAVNLTWGFNKVMTTLGLNGASLPPTQTSDSLTGLSLTGNTSWVLSAGDGTNTAVASTAVQFQPRRWWGTSALAALASSDILTLGGSELATSRNQSRSMSASAAYLYFAWPSSFGVPSFTVNGLPSTAWLQTTIEATNASGYVQSYDIYRSQYLQNGSGISVVVS
jgi:hypothetical protein